MSIVLILALLSCLHVNAMDKIDEMPLSETVGSGPFGENRVMFICPERAVYRKAIDTPVPEELTAKDVFCDETIMRKNCIVLENHYYWLILNSGPYTTDGFHLMWLPKRHVDDDKDLSAQEEGDKLGLFRLLEQTFNSDCHQIRFGLNKGKSSGQSVPHLHWHIIIRTRGARPMHEELALIETEKEALSDKKNRILALLALKKTPLINALPLRIKACKPCWYAHLPAQEDNDKLVIYRDKDFLIVYPPSSDYSGQVALVPVKHVHTIAQLDHDTVAHFFSLIKKISRSICAIADGTIRSCSSLNTEIITYGEHEKKRDEYNHIFCLLTPRTAKNQSCVDINGGGYHPFNVKVFCQQLKVELSK